MNAPASTGEYLIKFLKSGEDIEPVESQQIFFEALKRKDPEFDRQVIEVAKFLAPDFSVKDFDYSNDAWPWHVDEISRGVYPLEKLPEHVRDLAKKLYYS
ncbi:MAG: hypothetical protein K8R21_15360 [Leptospira sp.]|nr:hypothetical protein [Leptospira sp.]